MAIRVMLYTGLRPAEVFRLTPSNVKNDALEIRETKTTGRRIPISNHIGDLPEFLKNGGFEGERGKTIAKTLSENFTSILRSNGFDNDRHVLYSLKDTLVERLQRQSGMSDDVIRGVIGHVSGQGNTRHYKTRFGDTSHGMARMRDALDAITYW
jgi:integrase